MKRFIPLSVLAGVLASFVAAGSAQAAPVSGGILGKLATAAQTSNSAVNVAWRRGPRSHVRQGWRSRWLGGWWRGGRGRYGAGNRRYGGGYGRNGAGHRRNGGGYGRYGGGYSRGH